MINHKIHLRYEVLYYEGLEIVLSLIENNMVDYLSFMDHSPGQGQYPTDEGYEIFAQKVWGIKDNNKVKEFLSDLKFRHKSLDWNNLKNIISKANEKNVKIASHDDDTKDKIDQIKGLGLSVSEFPMNIETALYAKHQGLYACVGAPNILRGGSHNNNLRAMDAVIKNCADIVCSDYLPTSLISAIFKIFDETDDIINAVNTATLNPSLATGINQKYGSIEAGKKADIIIVDIYDSCPIVRKTISNGSLV